MTQNNRLAVSNTGNAIANPNAWQVMREQASVLVKSGFLPTSVKTPEAAIAIMMTGAEFGLKPMQSFRMISIVQGRPTMSADGMAALVMQWCRQFGTAAYIKVVETTNERCTVEYKRPESEPRQYTFTIDDAKRADLAGKSTWKQYPAAMLRARAVSAAARMGFPDVVAGVYDPEELGAEIRTDFETGEIINVNPMGQEVPINAYSIDELQVGFDRQGNEIRPQEPQNRPRAMEAPKQGNDTPIDRAAIMRRLHAVAKNAGISHEQLHGAAVARKCESLADMDPHNLAAMADYIEHQTDAAVAYFAQFLPEAETVEDGMDAEALFTPEQRAALDAEADRQQRMREVTN